MKGDVLGMAEPGEASDKVAWSPTVPRWSCSPCPATRPKGVPVRASVSELRAPLLGRILDLNDTQTSVLSLVFHYADTNGLLLVDLEDLHEASTPTSSSRWARWPCGSWTARPAARSNAPSSFGTLRNRR
jgi:DNA double-strand break repair helicase HerA and related ATPase